MNMSKKSGFTLIEVLIAMAVSLIIMGGAYTVFTSFQKNTTIQTNVSDMQQTLRAVMNFMAQDIRMAGYDPDNSSEFRIFDIQFRDLNDNLNANGNSFIQLSWDKNSNGVLDNDETMDYSLVDGATITPGVPDLYLRTPNNPTPPPTPPRNVIGSNIIALGLAYAIDTNDDGELEVDAGGNIAWFIDAGNDNDWDSLTVNQGAGTNTITDTGITVDVRNIRSVRIWMLAQSQAPDPKYTDTKTYVVGPHINEPVDRPDNRFRHRMLERIILCRNLGL